MKILNLYAGGGGNREKWGDEHEITAVELNPKVAEEYKDAGVTPVFLLDTEHMDLFVVCEETFKKKLN